jgi:serine phosphatase RsbU (regulator of sigma subunit)/tetratricopeptide (TPR) repeat protein
MEQVSGDVYAFVHDRLGEALIGNLSEDELQNVHQGIAEALDRRKSELAPEELHALARSYARGHVDRNPRRVFETSLESGILASQDHSNELALVSLNCALGAARKAGLEEHELVRLYEALGEACSRLGRDAEARQHLERALAEAHDSLDVARLRFLIALALFNAGKAIECWKYIGDSLEAAGAPLPKSRLLQWVYMFWYWMIAVFFTRTNLRYGSARGRQREILKVINRVYEVACPIAMALGNWTLVQLITFRWLLLGVRVGASAEYGQAHCFYAYMLGAIGERAFGTMHAEVTSGLGKQLGDGLVHWSGKQREVLINHMHGEERSFGADVKHREWMTSFKKWLPPWESVAMVASYVTSQFWRGHNRESIRFAEEHMETGGEDRRHLVMQSIALGSMYTQRHILGRHAEAAKAREAFVQMVGELGFVPWVQGIVYYFDIITMLDQEDFTRMEEAIAGYMQVVYETHYEEPWTRFGYMVVLEGQFELFARAKGRARQKARRDYLRVRRLARSRAWPSVFKCYLLAIDAAFDREVGRIGQARRKLEEAEELAVRADSNLALYLIARERARIAAARGNTFAARKEAAIALDLAGREGWVSRVRRIKEEFKIAEVEVAPATVMGSHSIVSATRHGSSTRHGSTESDVTSARYAKALLQVSLASTSTLEPADQAKAALGELVKVLGAERGFLFLQGPDGEMKLAAGKDQAGHDLEQLGGFSRTVVQQVAKERTPLVMAGTEEGEAMGAESVVANDLRSILASPLMFRDSLLGVVYLDSRLVKGLFTEDDLGILHAIANHIAIALENARAAQLEVKRQALQKELALTAAVQSLFLPKKSTLNLGKCQVSGFYRPAAECGGDWWWFGPSRTGRARLLLGDVTGHGAASAMVTASVATVFKMLDQTGTATTLDDILRELSLSLLQTTDGKYRMTMSAAEVDEDQGTLTWLNAGAPPLAVLSNEGQVKVNNGASTVLGDHSFAPAKMVIKAAKGDRFFFFTDGLTELKLPNGMDFGIRRLTRLLQKTAGLHIEEATRTIVGGLDEARKGTEQEDDITFALLDWT